MVDHVEFESPEIIEKFINYWRETGLQRYGLLYGTYEPHTTPLGIKAVVKAIYEPLQQNAKEYIQVLDSPLVSFSALLGLEIIGMIYTDLKDDGKKQGTVVCKRHADSYFMSSAECIYSSQMQSKHPTKTHYSRTKEFGSRFVTGVVTGDMNGGIDVQCYQTSNTAMNMVRDGILEASVKPDMMRVKSGGYVPEVFYKYKNKYGIMVKEAAKPTFPTEYLLVTVIPLNSSLNL